MLKQLSINNFRGFSRIDLDLTGQSSTLLEGPIGSGKSTILMVLEVLQQIGRGISTVELFDPKDLVYRSVKGAKDEIITSFAITVELDDDLFGYIVKLKFYQESRKVEVYSEKLYINNEPIFKRKSSTIQLFNAGETKEIDFRTELMCLPILQFEDENTRSIKRFKEWLGNMVLLSPVLEMIHGKSSSTVIKPDRWGVDFASWMSGLIIKYPKIYTIITDRLKQFLPDFKEFDNEQISKDHRNLVVTFSPQGNDVIVDFENLSEGEKVVFIFATLLAANEVYGPLLCIWDRPETYIPLPDIGRFIREMCNSITGNNGQLVIISNNEETISNFPDENKVSLEYEK